MTSAYKKTAKDLAFDRERAKLTSDIRKLREEVSYWRNAADKANECANQFEELYLESLEYLNMTPEELQKMNYRVYGSDVDFLLFYSDESGDLIDMSNEDLRKKYNFSCSYPS